MTGSAVTESLASARTNWRPSAKIVAVVEYVVGQYLAEGLVLLNQFVNIV